MKIIEIKQLIEKYGKETTLETVLHEIQGDRKYECPKCHGKGSVSVEYNKYDKYSGWIVGTEVKDEQCDLCNGHGYTRDKYQPKVKVIDDGWEKVDED
ncbi:hypothetical protein [Ligilactobacillus salivarius]|uniref:hypothetical protein n=1 Tax=Ligilactobacillus salivarius TaxID=1624 RepID=UPI000B96FDC1|nr:hypothetical protein [Ligilactobacillus salivarius]OYP91316.1 hypothetical protein B9G67_05170 [Ligilactobacillus salivarius]